MQLLFLTLLFMGEIYSSKPVVLTAINGKYQGKPKSSQMRSGHLSTLDVLPTHLKALLIYLLHNIVHFRDLFSFLITR